jgi:hypothetical protein
VIGCHTAGCDEPVRYEGYELSDLPVPLCARCAHDYAREGYDVRPITHDLDHDEEA